MLHLVLELRQHNLPHIHVKYNDQDAIYSIPEGNLLEGNLPKAKEKLILAWIELRKEELFIRLAIGSFRTDNI